MATPEGGTVPPYDALLATYRIGVDDKPLGELGRRLRETLTSSGLRVGLVNGGAETVGYEVGRVSQALYLAAAQNKEFALLWLAPHVRSAFGRREPAEEIGTFLTLGMPIKEENLLDHLEEEATHGAVAGAGLPAELRDLVGEYLGRRDVVALRRAQTVFPQYEFTYLHEPDSGRSFLVLKPRGAAPVAVANLAPLDPGGEAAAPAGPPDRVTLARYLDAGAAWLLLGAAPAESPR